MKLRKSNDWYLKLIVIFFSLAAVSIVGYVHFNPPASKAPRVNTDAVRVPTPSSETQQALRRFVDERDWVIGIAIIKVDFNNNTYQPVFRYFELPALEQEWDSLQWSGSVFSTDEAHNRRILNLINGETTCVNSDELLRYSRAPPNLQRHSTVVCMVSVPPAASDFTGAINIFLKHEPSQVEVEELRTEISKLSMEFYQRDVKRCRFLC